MFVQGWGDEEDWEVGINRCKLLYIEWINNKVLLDFLGDPVVRTPCFPCRRHRFNPQSEI